MELLLISCLIGAISFLIIIWQLALKFFYTRVPINTALVYCRGPHTTLQVAFIGAFIPPYTSTKEFIDLSLHTLEFEYHGANSIRCKDMLRADITLAYYIHLNPTTQDVLLATSTLGLTQASDLQALKHHFGPIFTGALQTVCLQFEFNQLYSNRDEFRHRLINHISHNLKGYCLADMAIDYVEQTPLEKLDPQNFMDAQAIKKITQRAAKEAMESNRIKLETEQAIANKNAATRQAMLELEHQYAALSSQTTTPGNEIKTKNTIPNDI